MGRLKVARDRAKKLNVYDWGIFASMTLGLSSIVINSPNLYPVLAAFCLEIFFIVMSNQLHLKDKDENKTHDRNDIWPR